QPLPDARCSMTGENFEKLIHAVSAAFPAADRLQSGCRQRGCKVLFLEHPLQLSRHLVAVAGVEKILAWPEKALGIVPGSADEWDACCKRLKDTDRRDARERLHIGAARYVNRHAVLCEGAGRIDIRNPAAIGKAGPPKRHQSLGWITHAPHRAHQAERGCRLHQKFAELGGALTVAPVADPDEIGLLFLIFYGPEKPRVGRLVPGYDLPAPAEAAITLGQRFAKGEHEIVIGEQPLAGLGFG